jgi:hypothetical protein
VAPPANQVNKTSFPSLVDKGQASGAITFSAQVKFSLEPDEDGSVQVKRVVRVHDRVCKKCLSCGCQAPICGRPVHWLEYWYRQAVRRASADLTYVPTVRTGLWLQDHEAGGERMHSAKLCT